MMDAPVVLLDTDGQVVDCNPPARNLVGIATGWRGMAIDEFCESVHHQIRQSDNSDAGSAEITLNRGGTKRDFDMRWSPIRPDGAAVVGRLIVLREITELNEQRQQLEQQNEQLDQFASMVSHDLRNPLNAAQLRLDLIARESDDENVQAVQDSLTRMETMIDELLELARSGQRIEETKQCQLGTIAAQSWADVQTDGAELDIRIDNERIEADSSRLRHIFENLYRNAIEHNDLPVAVRVGLLENGGGFYVEDDGTGIPEDKREDVFEHGHSSSDGGTGFGLWIVKNLVDAHGWRIVATAGSDGGARFEIRTE